MLYLQGKFMKVTELAARGDYPPSHLVTVFDEGTADTLNLICDAATFAVLSSSEQFADVTLRLRWRRIDLATLGGSGRGKAYRLQATGVVES